MSLSFFAITRKGTDEKLALRELPTLRQAFFVASTLVLAGVGLGLMVSPWFFALDILVGGGLMFSALAGFCPMVGIVEHMPWNRRG